MKVVPHVSRSGDTHGYKLLLSGRRQYDVSWKEGENVVRVAVLDEHEGHTAFQELTTVNIPSDYHGKMWRDIAKGMEEHLMCVSRQLVRDWGGYGVMDEFRNEWAMHKWSKGQKVSYSTVRGGVVKGVVKGVSRDTGDRARRDVIIRVTSRNNALWSAGDEMRVAAASPWLESREV
ncbi:hypothetical protein [Streptomyces antibioticus]|uniref:hypothetical protein n=1 Tax=Streptomyces antibioticus TaxID=1890 RepID=UPI00340FAF0B